MTTAPPTAGKWTLLPGQDPDGKYILAVLLKRSYRMIPFGPCERAEADRLLLAGDKHYADPMSSAVRFEADFVPYKLATDVVLNGTAFAPSGPQAREFITSLEVSRAKKSVRVVGDRLCRYRSGGDPVFGEPQPFTEMPLRYERAYGGVDVESDHRAQFPYPRNPLGKGFAIDNVKGAIEGLELPNLEDPADPLTPARVVCGHIQNWAKQPMPTGFGWYSKFWHPRAEWAGILPGRPTRGGNDAQSVRGSTAAAGPRALREASASHRGLPLL